MSILISDEFIADKDTALFEIMVKDISSKGYSIHPNALPTDLLFKLSEHLQVMPSSTFKRAGVGRNNDHTINNFVRTDEIFWIEGDTEVESKWLCWAQSLQKYINRHLFLNLSSFESHFSHYAEGDFYKKHKDAFKGESNRVLSMVVYLNSGWMNEDGGELVIYTGKSNQDAVKVIPGYGTIVLFLSEEFLHEVLPAKRDRFSIAGWFRVNDFRVDNQRGRP